jgi:hypothetical protein
MAYTSGTADNYKDLLAILATFVSSNGWTIMEQTEVKLCLKGVGLGGLDEIYCNIEAFENTSSGYYNWKLSGAWAWRSGRAANAQPRASITNTHEMYIYLWNSSIPYWIICNGRRIILIAKISTTFQTAYLGLGTPPATEAQYPYPLVIGGSGYIAAQAYSVASSANASFWGKNQTVYGSGQLCMPGGSWGSIGTGTESQYAQAVKSASANLANSANIVTTPGGLYILEPIYLVHSSGKNVFCELDGMFRISGYNNSSENIVTVSGINYIVVQDVYRVTYGDYCCARLN